MTMPLASGEVVALCGREHTACRKKRGGTFLKYKMFSAAAEGCLMCVRYYVEREGIHHDAASENKKYTALDFAQWAFSQDKTDTQAVQEYLGSFTQDRARGTQGLHAAQGLVPVIQSRAWLPAARCPTSQSSRGPMSSHDTWRLHIPGKASGNDRCAPYQRLDPERAFRHDRPSARGNWDKSSGTGSMAPTSTAKPPSQWSLAQKRARTTEGLHAAQGSVPVVFPGPLTTGGAQRLYGQMLPSGGAVYAQRQGPSAASSYSPENAAQSVVKDDTSDEEFRALESAVRAKVKEIVSLGNRRGEQAIEEETSMHMEGLRQMSRYIQEQDAVLRSGSDRQSNSQATRRF